MKNSSPFFKLFFLFFSISQVLISHQPSSPPLGWLDEEEVHVSDQAFFLDTNLGRVDLTVHDYDAEKGRYLVECIKYGENFYPTVEGTEE